MPKSSEFVVSEHMGQAGLRGRKGSVYVRPAMGPAPGRAGSGVCPSAPSPKATDGSTYP